MTGRASDLVVRPIPGAGRVARLPGLVLLVLAADQPAQVVIDTGRAAAASPTPGDRLAADLDGLEPGWAPPPYAAIADVTDGTRILAFDGVEVVVRTDPVGPDRVMRAPAGERIDELVTEPLAWIRAAADDTAVPADPLASLDSGVVRAGAVVLGPEPATVAAALVLPVPIPPSVPPSAPPSVPPSFPPTAGPSPVDHPPPPTASVPAAAVAALVFDDGRAVTLDTDLVVGREPFGDPRLATGEASPVVVDDPGRTVSRIHAEVRRHGDRVVVIDRGSTNGTYRWDAAAGTWRRLEPGRPEPLGVGDHVSFGQRTSRLVASGGNS